MIIYREAFSVTAIPGSEALKLSPTDKQNFTNFTVCQLTLQARYSLYESYSHMQQTPHEICAISNLTSSLCNQPCAGADMKPQI
jgi:hypothetical protein